MAVVEIEGDIVYQSAQHSAWHVVVIQQNGC